MFPIKETNIFEIIIMITNIEIELLEQVDIFLENIDPKAREKIIYNLWKFKLQKDRKLFKKLTHEIWEFRTKFAENEYRLLAFWKKEKGLTTIIIATNGFVKKSQKTPKTEIEKAMNIRQYYLNK
ncbi:type II toxin-antitoxin system RelE/ParE family toxin [Aquirufa sp. ROCK-SH2]